MGDRALEIALPSSRAEAIAVGSKKYFSPKPCPRGHISPRWVNAGCCECSYVSCRKWQIEDKQRANESSKASHAKNREIHRRANRNYRGRHKGRINYNTAMRYAAKRERTPPWADKEDIRRIYENCPPGMHVDHIVPLMGDVVSGLHVSWNLQYLTPEENAIKSNKWSTDQM